MPSWKRLSFDRVSLVAFVPAFAMSPVSPTVQPAMAPVARLHTVASLGAAQGARSRSRPVSVEGRVWRWAWLSAAGRA